MKKTTDRKQYDGALLVSCQQAAHCLGLTKKDVRTMVDEGLLHTVLVGGKTLITTRPIIHMLGYDPFGL